MHLNPIKVLHCVEELLDENSILVADGGDFVGTAAYILRYTALLYTHKHCCSIMIPSYSGTLQSCILINIVVP